MSERKVAITVVGEPVAQGRPRISTRNGKIRAIDPERSREWKMLVHFAAIKAVSGMEMLEGPLSISIQIFKSMPSSFSLRRRASAKSGIIKPITRPDLDNYVKAVMDALNGIVFKDDSMVVNFHEPFGKWYSDRPRVEIEVKELD